MTPTRLPSAMPAGGTSLGISPDTHSRDDRTDEPGLPVLDRDVLDSLSAELSSRTGALHFADAFVELLPQRIDAVEAAFEAGDMDAAVVALLSLFVSSSMVGARRLEQASSSALDFAVGRSARVTRIGQFRSLSVEFQSALGGIIR